ncbi:efflux RND transporter periplasmic adaptor subunit [Alishewanella jeotgali]|uniref:RND family efflux transporter MFP subunit n=1 Tax=Alishewanella jeotgali KCTC 22429 TaxID=1129374 RepID=H3ZC71_9ALTE|nr:efflux RND transporter periplasmic adaptor subunit [Alishewanella jeotgali]EHR41916.1 RND family efflux transporter MFP subunit [Alishewanella jeotgali KCTC 22429]
MKKLTTVQWVATGFVVITAGTLALGLAMQTPGHQHAGHADHAAHANHEDHTGHDHDLAAAFSAETQEYTCSMHPTFRSTDPNDRCPICGMELIPVSGGRGGEGPTEIEFSGRALALLGVQTEPVRRGDAEQVIRLSGQLEFDERALTSISAWTGGRIERLYVNYTGAYVEAGARLVELYSPELFVAQQELLQATRQANQDAPAFLRDSQATTLRAARERLRLLGLSNEQIDAVITRGEARDRITIHAPTAGLVVTRNVSQGDYVNTGDVIVELADEQRMWALFEVFERDLGAIQVGQYLEFSVQGQREMLHGEVISIAPRIDPERRTRTVRVALEAGEQALSAGGFTRAEVHITQSDKLTIPTSAALLTGRRAVVYVALGEGRFAPRTVELGQRFGDRLEVIDGLEEGDTIVSRGAFRIDSELQLQGRPSMMSPEGEHAGGHGHGHDAHAQHNDHGVHEMAAMDELAVTGDFSQVDLSAVTDAYMGMWEALHSDDLSAWQSSAKIFFAALDATQWPTASEAVYELLATGKGHAHHVGNINTARDQFFAHSQGMIALAEAGVLPNTIYLMYCPMARRGQGAHWLQPNSGLLNPYFGATMLRCGDELERFEGQSS